MCQYNQTIDITSLNFYRLGMVGIQILYRNKQYFVITEIVLTRVYCTYSCISTITVILTFTVVSMHTCPILCDAWNTSYTTGNPGSDCRYILMCVHYVLWLVLLGVFEWSVSVRTAFPFSNLRSDLAYLTTAAVRTETDHPKTQHYELHINVWAVIVYNPYQELAMQKHHVHIGDNGAQKCDLGEEKCTFSVIGGFFNVRRCYMIWI